MHCIQFKFEKKSVVMQWKKSYTLLYKKIEKSSKLSAFKYQLNILAVKIISILFEQILIFRLLFHQLQHSKQKRLYRGNLETADKYEIQ